MANLPGSGYLSDDDRIEGEMKTALEQLHDVIAEIGSKEVITDTINSGSIDAPLASMISVSSEGGASTPDELDSIGRTNITQGRIVILKNTYTASTAADGAYITVNHSDSTGAIVMLDGENFILCSKRQLALIYTGDRWIELWRTYGRNTPDEKLKEREDIGLGDVSTLDIAVTTGAVAANKVLKVGPANTIAEDDLLAMDASGNIKTGTVTGGNADTLNDIADTGFVRSNATVAQTIDESLTLTSAGDTTLVIADTAGSNSPGVSFKSGSDERASIFVTSADGISEWRTKTSLGANTESVRLNPLTNRFEFSLDASSWQSLTPGAGNGLNADQLDGAELVDIPLYVHTNSSHRTITFATSNFNNYGEEGGTNRQAVPQFTDLEYPVEPNGIRRFLVTAHVHYKVDGIDSNRQSHMILYSSASPGSISSGNEIMRQTGPDNSTGNGFTAGDPEAELGLWHRRVVPGVGHKLTLAMEETGGDNKSDMLADTGSKSLFGTYYTELGNDAQRSKRTFVLIEYLDEGA